MARNGLSISREEDTARADFEDGYRAARRAAKRRLMSAKRAQTDAAEALAEAQQRMASADAAAVAAAREYGGVLQRYGNAVASLSAD